MPLLAHLAIGRLHLLALGAAFLSVRISLAGPISNNFRRLDNPIAFAPSTLSRYLSCARVHTASLSLLVWPHTLSADYSFDALPLVKRSASRLHSRKPLQHDQVLADGGERVVMLT